MAREKELDRLHEILETTARRRTAVIHGLGGMGKTQLAIAFFKRHRTEYSAVIWLNARDESSLKQSLAHVAERIRRYDPSMTYISSAVESRDADRMAEAVKRWLDEPANDRWLLIYDNYDHPMASINTQRRGRQILPEGTHTDEEAESDEDQADAKAFDLRSYLPETDHGAVIITSRLLVKLGQPIPLGKLDAVSESLEILVSTSGRHSLKQGKLYEDLE